MQTSIKLSNSIIPLSLKNSPDWVEEKMFLKAVVKGFEDIEKGMTVPMADARKRLGLVQYS